MDKFDWMQGLRDTAEHLVRMSQTPGWEEYARTRRDQLLADPMNAGLREEILRVLARLKEGKPDG